MANIARGDAQMQMHWGLIFRDSHAARNAVTRAVQAGMARLHLVKRRDLERIETGGNRINCALGKGFWRALYRSAVDIGVQRYLWFCRISGQQRVRLC